MTSTVPSVDELPTQDILKFNWVAALIEEKIECLPGEGIQFLSILADHVEESRRTHYSLQVMTDELVVKIMGKLLRLPGLEEYVMSMLGILLLDSARGERRLRCQDWTEDKPRFALFITFG